MRIWLLAAVLVSSSSFAGTPYPDAPHVVANGEGKVSVAPDEATIEITTEIHNPNAALAKQAVDRSGNAFLKVAPNYALTPDDITAADIALSEDTDRNDDGKRVSNGFEASRQVTIKLHDLTRLNDVLDAAIAAGLAKVDDVTFASSHADDLRRQARAKAAADARAKAADLANAFEATLGPVYSIDSVSSYRSGSYGGSPNTLDRIEVTGKRINNGRYLEPSVEYSERVSIVFELKRP
jgi:uncharacterized protein YggE